MALKKSIAIIGEGETEWWYFETLRVACRYKFKVAPDFPQHSDIPHMAKLAEDYVRRETDHVVCLVDMDRLLSVPAEMATYQQLKRKSSRNVVWVETNPCTEFWFLLHFLPQLSTKQPVCLPDGARRPPTRHWLCQGAVATGRNHASGQDGI